MKCHVAIWTWKANMKLSHLNDKFSTYFMHSACAIFLGVPLTACIHSSGVREPPPCSDTVNSIHDPEANLNVQCLCSSIL